MLTRLEKYNEEAPRYEVEEWFVPVEFGATASAANFKPLILTEPSISIWAMRPRRIHWRHAR